VNIGPLAGRQAEASGLVAIPKQVTAYWHVLATSQPIFLCRKQPRAILTYDHGRNAGFADGIVTTPSRNPPEDGGLPHNNRTVRERRCALEKNRRGLRFGGVKVRTVALRHFSETEAYLGDVYPNVVRVELYAEETGGAWPVRQKMTNLRQLADTAGPATEHAARVIPRRASALVAAMMRFRIEDDGEDS
jgi:hypothetical protein